MTTPDLTNGPTLRHVIRIFALHIVVLVLLRGAETEIRIVALHIVVLVLLREAETKAPTPITIVIRVHHEPQIVVAVHHDLGIRNVALTTPITIVGVTDEMAVVVNRTTPITEIGTTTVEDMGAVQAHPQTDVVTATLGMTIIVVQRVSDYRTMVCHRATVFALIA